ncbi:Protein trunk [Mizuhopecten yessoensis]|uniref:Protein trunk n=1 Tax=Mizuhopecten yessoensis TaxID=6573 RepID=A0A210PXC9_MIZYE|nr:Protein trunk [Mizuhopecten yessoensis]
MVSTQHIPLVPYIDEYNVGEEDGTSDNTEGNSPYLQKRNEPFSEDEELPWSCGMEYTWTDLGQNHHPRHVREANCVNSSCWYGHYSCVPLTFNIKVLYPNDHDSVDGKLPAALRQDYVFRDVGVTVGCQCVRTI